MKELIEIYERKIKHIEISLSQFAIYDFNKQFNKTLKK